MCVFVYCVMLCVVDVVAGIQQHLFENGRVDNIFSDGYFYLFNECLKEVLVNCQPKYNSSGMLFTLVMIEHRHSSTFPYTCNRYKVCFGRKWLCGQRRFCSLSSGLMLMLLSTVLMLLIQQYTPIQSEPWV